jgi:hypothetical protein
MKDAKSLQTSCYDVVAGKCKGTIPCVAGQFIDTGVFKMDGWLYNVVASVCTGKTPYVAGATITAASFSPWTPEEIETAYIANTISPYPSLTGEEAFSGLQPNSLVSARAGRGSGAAEASGGRSVPTALRVDKASSGMDGPDYEVDFFGRVHKGEAPWMTKTISSAAARIPTANAMSERLAREGPAPHAATGIISLSSSLLNDCRTSTISPPPPDADTTPPSEVLKAWRAAEAETLANCQTANRWADQIAARYAGPGYDALGVWGEQSSIARAYAAYLRHGGVAVINAWHLAGSPEPIEWLCRNGYDSPLYLEAYEATGVVPAGSTSVEIHHGRSRIVEPLLDREYFNLRGLPPPILMTGNGGTMGVRVWFMAPCVKADAPTISGRSSK